jgi:hypothetical protein
MPPTDERQSITSYPRSAPDRRLGAAESYSGLTASGPQITQLRASRWRATRSGNTRSWQRLAADAHGVRLRGGSAPPGLAVSR